MTNSNCSHTGEKGCAVLAAIENGELTEKRFKNYLKMINELSFQRNVLLRKKKKAKDFGMMIKTTMKNKNKR